MKKKNNWFTFIELLVVTSILIIISTSSVFYFFWFIDQTNLNTWVDMVKQDILDLDKKIKNKDILDYKLFLKKWSLFMYDYENTLNLNNILEFSWTINYDTWSWQLFLNPLWNTNDALNIIVYANDKKLKDYIISWDSKMDIWLYKFKKYRVNSTYSWQILNNINLDYFSENNLDHKKQNYLRLVKISTDKNNDLDSIYINNILWRKSFSDNINSNLLKLTFDFNWKEKTLEIKK